MEKLATGSRASFPENSAASLSEACLQGAFRFTAPLVGKSLGVERRGAANEAEGASFAEVGAGTVADCIICDEEPMR